MKVAQKIPILLPGSVESAQAPGAAIIPGPLDELALTEQLIRYDTSHAEGVRLCAGFVNGWLEARGIVARQLDVRGLPVILAEVGPEDAPTVVLHGHIDVVPGHAEQFEPRLDGDRLIGRGAYDMKGAMAAMLLALHDIHSAATAGSENGRLDPVRVRLAVVPDEESEEAEDRASDRVVDEGFVGDFAITGEPTDLHIGVQAKGVLALRLRVSGTAAHGATPWLGDNAVLKALDVFRRIESLPFARQSSELFDRPSINLGRIWGGDALNKVPDACIIDVDIRYLPEQDPQAIRRLVEAIADTEIVSSFSRPPAVVSSDSVFVRTLGDAVAPSVADGPTSVGRDGASDAVSFLRVGVPAVEFGPTGGGHHGPEEWVSVSSLQAYRQALGTFVRTLPAALSREAERNAG
ncbi:MAG: succinyl-diaminopimelate desuccinylase [Solirubrobacterales bacterium]|nr:succinyl-diaminopimelate desuccinylase [Solirubrobacterales bacterium]